MRSIFVAVTILLTVAAQYYPHYGGYAGYSNGYGMPFYRGAQYGGMPWGYGGQGYYGRSFGYAPYGGRIYGGRGFGAGVFPGMLLA